MATEYGSKILSVIGQDVVMSVVIMVPCSFVRSNRRIGEDNKTGRSIKIKRGSSCKGDKRFTSKPARSNQMIGEDNKTGRSIKIQRGSSRKGDNQQGQKQGLDNTARQLDECKQATHKIREVQTQHLERFENLEQKTESLKLKEEYHEKEIKDLQ
ncbi:hypothetical protein AM593_07106, partial [Mytilus galloprovincialis]